VPTPHQIRKLLTAGRPGHGWLGAGVLAAVLGAAGCGGSAPGEPGGDGGDGGGHFGAWTVDDNGLPAYDFTPPAHWAEPPGAFHQLGNGAITALAHPGGAVELFTTRTFPRFVNRFDDAAGHWAGFRNFEFLLARDDTFWKSIRLSLIWCLSVVAIQMSLGFALALLLDRSMRGIGILRTLLVIPVFIAPVALGLTWRYMYEPVSGVLNYLLTSQSSGSR